MKIPVDTVAFEENLLSGERLTEMSTRDADSQGRWPLSSEKDRNANKKGPLLAEAAAGLSGPETQGGTYGQFPAPRRADAAPRSALASEDERQLDHSLRPHSLAEFVGQERIKKVLGMSIAAARQRGEALDRPLRSRI